MTDYTPQHIAAYLKWRRVGSVELTDADVDAIEREDPEQGREIRVNRARAREAAEEEAHRRKVERLALERRRAAELAAVAPPAAAPPRTKAAAAQRPTVPKPPT